MKKLILIIASLVVFNSAIHSQVSTSSEKYNAVKEIVQIPEGMAYDEFLKIQREIDWKKIAVASILPGYIHFYANKPELGWAIAGTRVVGYALMGYAMFDQYQLTNSLNFGTTLNSESEQNRTKNNAIMFSAGLVLNMVGFAFDWAYGNWVIESERNEVYFKYGLDKERRKSLGLSYNSQYKIPVISFSLQL